MLPKIFHLITLFFQITRLSLAIGPGLVLLAACHPGTPSASNAAASGIVYLGWETRENGNQLYLIQPDGSGQKRLTSEPLGVVDYAAAPDGTVIVYSAVNEDGGSDLWRIDANGQRRKRLLTCAAASCTQPAWHPDGRRLIYERRDGTTLTEAPIRSRLWWLDTQTGETIPVFADEQMLGLGANISPNGRYLSYISATDQQIHVYELATGDSIIIPSQTGEPAAWSPDSSTLIVGDIQYQGEQFAVHLFSAKVSSAELTNISGTDLDTDDGQPVFSPAGTWLAFSRKKPRAPMGRQLWLMQPDGSIPRPLTADAEIHYNNQDWSPDGSQLVTQALPLTEPEAEPALWLIDVSSGEMRELAAPGIQPTWLPYRE